MCGRARQFLALKGVRVHPRHRLTVLSHHLHKRKSESIPFLPLSAACCRPCPTVPAPLRPRPVDWACHTYSVELPKHTSSEGIIRWSSQESLYGLFATPGLRRCRNIPATRLCSSLACIAANPVSLQVSGPLQLLADPAYPPGPPSPALAHPKSPCLPASCSTSGMYPGTLASRPHSHIVRYIADTHSFSLPLSLPTLGHHRTQQHTVTEYY